jgi:uncharacterized OB-fold protein
MTMEAQRYEDGSITYPPHPVGPGGSDPVETVDLSEYTADIVTWTESTATPPGVREPPLRRRRTRRPRGCSVRDGEAVRAIGQLTTDDVAIGDEVRPGHVDELREPGAGIREPESQEWDGYRFEPVSTTETS